MISATGSPVGFRKREAATDWRFGRLIGHRHHCSDEGEPCIAAKLSSKAFNSRMIVGCCRLFNEWTCWRQAVRYLIQNRHCDPKNFG